MCVTSPAEIILVGCCRHHIDVIQKSDIDINIMMTSSAEEFDRYADCLADIRPEHVTYKKKWRNVLTVKQISFSK